MSKKLLSIDDLAADGREEIAVTVICDNGREYSGTYVNKYFPGGTVFFCIPKDVEILGYKEA